METTVITTRTVKDSATDMVFCDGCNKVLDMNLHVKDRETRYDLRKQVEPTGRYFVWHRYDLVLEEMEYIHLCPRCAQAKLEEWADSRCIDDIEYSFEGRLGRIIPDELKAMEEEKAKKTQDPKEKRETAQRAMVEESVAAEEAMLAGFIRAET